VVLDSYFWAAQHGGGLKNRIRQRWWWHFVIESMRLVRTHSIAKLVGACIRDMEGDDETIEIEKRIGKLIGLARMRSRYSSARRDVAHAAWRRCDSMAAMVDQ